jgi:hypothetical protein
LSWRYLPSAQSRLALSQADRNLKPNVNRNGADALGADGLRG